MAAPKILINALRQYQHNDCSGLLFGFDYKKTISIVNNLQNNFQSEIKDINGVEIKADDTVELTIKIQHQTKPLKFIKKIIFERGAFRFDDENKGCIGDIAHNCTLEIIHN